MMVKIACNSYDKNMWELVNHGVNNKLIAEYR